MGVSSIIVEPVSTGLSRLLPAVYNDSYQPGEGNWLDFLDALRNKDHRAVPFWPLLQPVIETHEKGWTNNLKAGASVADKALPVVLEFVNRFENIIERKMNTFFHEAG